MRASSLLLLAFLPLAACQRDGLPPDPDVHIDAPPDTAQHPAATDAALPGQQRLGSDPYAVVPGVRVGQVRLGMPFDSVLVALGQPPRADAGVGYVWGGWHGWGEARTSWVDVFALAAEAGASGYRVSQIRVDGPPFHTESNLPANARRAEVLRLYPTARPYGTDDLYDDRRGIAFAFDAPGDEARATALLVVTPGTRAADLRPLPDAP